MAKLYAMYKHPTDPAAFDRYYYGVHVPLAKTIPGLRRERVGTSSVTSPSRDQAPRTFGDIRFRQHTAAPHTTKEAYCEAIS